MSLKHGFPFVALLLGLMTASAQPGFNPMAGTNVNPAMLRQALSQFPGITTGCVDLLISQLTTCTDYFAAVQNRFPDIATADGNEVLSYVTSNPPSSGCCAAINEYNSAKCICEEGALPLVRQFPDRYWGLLEAGRCPQMVGPVYTPELC